nr:organic cation transporter protein-like isoform X1 [Dermacentor andersoni]
MSTIDDILLHLGPWHYPVLAFCFFRGFPAAYYAMSLSFTAPSLRHWCARPPQLANWTTERWLLEAVPPTHVNEKAMPSQCETYSIEVLVNGTISILNDSTVRCSSWEYDLGDNTNTMTNDFNLVCDRVWLRAASQSFYMAGIMIGNFIFSHMSDWYGRKRALVFMTPLPVLASVVMCLSTSFLMLNIGRFVASLGLGGILNTTYTMSMEVLSARHRALGSLISTGGWTTGLLTMTGLAWLFRDWMLFQGVITIAALGGAVNWFFIPESPRWLLAMGRYDEAREELEKAVRKNKVTGVSVEAIIKEFKDKISKDKLSSKPTFADLFRSRSIRITSCLLSSKSVLDTLVYYNLTYSSILLGDPYLSFALVAAAEYPGRLLGVVAVNYLRRRTAYIGLYVFASICSAVAIFVPADASWALMASALLAKMGLIAAHCVNVVQMSELYPTRLRTTAMGFTITTSRVGAILAPFTKELGVVFFPWVPKVVDITVCACLILVSLPLPETFKEPLPDTLHDIKKAKKSRKGKDPVDPYVAAEAQPLR